jgi:hypothetical protein
MSNGVFDDRERWPLRERDELFRDVRTRAARHGVVVVTERRSMDE